MGYWIKSHLYVFTLHIIKHWKFPMHANWKSAAAELLLASFHHLIATGQRLYRALAIRGKLGHFHQSLLDGAARRGHERAETKSNHQIMQMVLAWFPPPQKKREKKKLLNNTLIDWPASGPSWTVNVDEEAWWKSSIPRCTFWTVRNKSAISSGNKSVSRNARRIGITKTSEKYIQISRFLLKWS